MILWIIAILLVAAAGAVAFYFHDDIMELCSKVHKETMEEIDNWKASLESEYDEKMVQLKELRGRLDKAFDTGLNKLADELKEEIDDIKGDIDEATQKLIDLV